MFAVGFLYIHVVVPIILESWSDVPVTSLPYRDRPKTCVGPRAREPSREYPEELKGSWQIENTKQLGVRGKQRIDSGSA